MLFLILYCKITLKHEKRLICLKEAGCFAMEDKLQKQSDLFIHNRNLMKMGFMWDYHILLGLVAMLCTAYGKEVQVDTIKRYRRILRDMLNDSSYYDEKAFLPIAAFMTLSDEPEALFERFRGICRLLIREGFEPSIYLMLAAATIVLHKDAGELPTIVSKAKSMYISLKHEPWFSKISRSGGYVETIAMSDKDSMELLIRDKRCYQILKTQFQSLDVINAINHVLVMGSGDAKLCAERAIDIYKGLEERGYAFYKKDFEYASLGVLGLLQEDTGKLAGDIIAVYDYLKKAPGLSSYRLKGSQRLVYASAIVESVYINSQNAYQKGIQKPGDTFIAMNISLIMAMAGDAACYCEAEILAK